MKAVLDCNVIISFLISPGKNISKIKSCLYKETYELLISDEILNEIEAIFLELEKEGFINSLESASLIKFLLKKSTNVNIKTITNICRDKNDNKYLSCSKDGKANYLVSGDDDLLILKRYYYTKIVNPQDFAFILFGLPNKIN